MEVFARIRELRLVRDCGFSVEEARVEVRCHVCVRLFFRSLSRSRARSLSVRESVCIHTYIHIDTHAYTYIHIHTHTYTYVSHTQVQALLAHFRATDPKIARSQQIICICVIMVRDELLGGQAFASLLGIH